MGKDGSSMHHLYLEQTMIEPLPARGMPRLPQLLSALPRILVYAYPRHIFFELLLLM